MASTISSEMAPRVEPEPSARLDFFDGSLMVLGSVLGAGVFLASGVVARHVVSPAAFIGVWIVGALVTLAGVLSVGELAALFPSARGHYAYLREAYGAPVGFLSGWTSFWIVFPGLIATLAWGFGHTVAGLAGDDSGRADVPLAFAAIVLLTTLNAAGRGQGKWARKVLEAAVMTVVLTLFALAILSPREGRSSFVPFVGGDRVSGFALALVPVFFAFNGWSAATQVSGELENPRKSFRRVLLAGTAACGALYVAVNVAFLRAISVPEMRGVIDVARPAFDNFSASATGVVLIPLVAVAILASLHSTLHAGPRLFQNMAEDGLFFSTVARVSGHSRTPVISLVAQAAIACVLLLAGTFERLLQLTTFSMLLLSTLAVAAVIVLRIRRRSEQRAFRTPWYPVIPLLFIGANLWVMGTVLATGATYALAGLATFALGVPAYLWFRRTRDAKPRFA